MVVSIILDIGLSITWWSVKKVTTAAYYTVNSVKEYIYPLTKDELTIRREAEFTKRLLKLMKEFEMDQHLLT